MGGVGGVAGGKVFSVAGLVGGGVGVAWVVIG
jgi:hypothetical protein